MNSFLRTCITVLLGFLVGAMIYHPKSAQATDRFKAHIYHVHVSGEETPISTPNEYSSYAPVALSCTGADCYVLVQSTY
jgi:hypothetical protein